MKTIKQLTLARIEMLYGKKDDIHWEMFKNDCIEKEKEQIIDAWIATDNKLQRLAAEDYYNQTYNQNK
jgi:hypothetical protein